MTNEPRIKAWHFVGDTLRGGDPVPADGEVLTHKGFVGICQSGFHASRRLIDALNYAPGMTACRVECWGAVEEESDKLVARNRVILWRVDAEDVLWRFARKQALSVAHLWDMPDITRQYLETGDLKLRAAADAAARAFTYAPGRQAAWRAASRAAIYASEDVNVYASAESATYAVGYAVDASGCAARSDAGYASAAYAAGCASARAAADKMLTEMIMAQHKENQK